MTLSGPILRMRLAQQFHLLSSKLHRHRAATAVISKLERRRVAFSSNLNEIEPLEVITKQWMIFAFLFPTRFFSECY